MASVAGPILTKPLTRDQLLQQVDDSGIIETHIAVDLAEIIDNDLEAFLDLLSERTIGSVLGCDIASEPVAVDEDGKIILRVRLDASMRLDGG